MLVDLAKRYSTRPGGYTRIVKLGPRRGDNAPMSIIELVGDASEPEAKGGAKATGASSKVATAAEPKEAAKVE